MQESLALHSLPHSAQTMRILLRLCFTLPSPERLLNLTFSSSSLQRTSFSLPAHPRSLGHVSLK